MYSKRCYLDISFEECCVSVKINMKWVIVVIIVIRQLLDLPTEEESSCNTKENEDECDSHRNDGN